MLTAEVVYFLCAFMSIMCAWQLLRSYRRSRARLLLWSSVTFVLLAVNNVVLVIDFVVLPNVEFGGSLLRDIIAAGAGLTMLFGLIWEVI